MIKLQSAMPSLKLVNLKKRTLKVSGSSSCPITLKVRSNTITKLVSFHSRCHLLKAIVNQSVSKILTPGKNHLKEDQR